MNLLEKISDFGNLSDAFLECSSGKKRSIGYQRAMFAHGEKLLFIRKKLLSGIYSWNAYREIIVKDPKTRLIMAAPFLDRVVHTAIHRVIGPLVEGRLSSSVYACRVGMGNRYAAIALLNEIKRLGDNRFVVKLDVRKYFDSINHDILMKMLRPVLPDKSIESLLQSLLASQTEYARRGYGIPIGNLTSQLFANFYLVEVDKIACMNNEEGFYFRYMDDMVLGGRHKSRVLDIAEAMVNYATDNLRLSIPFHKRMPLGSAPVPFLGYVLDHGGYRVLTRNIRRHKKRVRRLEKSNARPSEIEIRNSSFGAFARLI